MRRTARLSATAAAAALLVCCGAAGPALAADGHGKALSQAKVAHHAKVAHVAKVKDPLAAPRRKGLADLTVYAKRLAAVEAIAAASPLLSSDEQGALDTAIVLEGVALRDDRVAVVRARTRKQVNAAVASGQRTVTGASLELALAVNAESHLFGAQTLSAGVDALSGQAQDAAAAGEDVTDVMTALAAAQVDLESAQGDEASAFSDVTRLTATPSAADLKAAMASARSDLALIDHDLADAAGDIALAESAYALVGSGAPVDPGATP